MSVNKSKNNKIPIIIIIIPPNFMIATLYFLIICNFVIKKVNTKNGMLNPSTYSSIYNIAWDEFVAANVPIAAIIGPLHGVHPAAKAIPIKNVPIKPEGFALKLIFLSFIKNCGWNTPKMINPNTIMMIAPTCLINV